MVDGEEGEDKSCRQEGLVISIKKWFVLAPLLSNHLNFLTSAHPCFHNHSDNPEALAQDLGTLNPNPPWASKEPGRWKEQHSSSERCCKWEQQLVKALPSPKEHFNKSLTCIRRLKHSARVELVFICLKKRMMSCCLYSSQEHRLCALPDQCFQCCLYSSNPFKATWLMDGDKEAGSNQYLYHHPWRDHQMQRCGA